MCTLVNIHTHIQRRGEGEGEGDRGGERWGRGGERERLFCEHNSEMGLFVPRSHVSVIRRELYMVQYSRKYNRNTNVCTEFHRSYNAHCFTF